MKLLLVPALFVAAPFVYAQEEVLSPLLSNPQVSKTGNLLKAGNSIDSTFVYDFDTLDLPVWDDFSVSKFEQYDADYGDGNVTSSWFYHLMNAGNTVPQPSTALFCDSIHRRLDTISVVVGIPTVTTYYTAATSIWVNDLSSHPVAGQVQSVFTTALNQCYTLIDSVIDGVPDPDQDTIFYAADYVQDSANVFYVNVNDPDVIWIDDYAYHNYRYAVDPWSLGVATFDGVSNDGFPYDFGNLSAHEQADVLTSRPINLAGKTNVYLIWIFQAEGRGNAPELNDSLILDIWLPDSNKWFKVWHTLGATTVDTWDTVHYAIPIAALDNGFRFRFRNWASTSGNLDHWHIDYVTLEDNQFPPFATVFKDVAVSEPINTLLDVYTAVPWEHFQNADVVDKMIDNLEVRVYNSNAVETNYADGQLEVRFEGNLQGGPYNLPNIFANWAVGINVYPYPLAANYQYDDNVTTAGQATFDVKLNIDAAVSGDNSHTVNDTTYYQQKFKNYYAYDDGSAEAGYGITGSHSFLAYKFEAYEADVLKGILMHFVPTVDNVLDNTFLLTIWDDNAGEPGNIIYQDDYFNTHSPLYSGSLNGFKYYTFQGGIDVAVPQTFYVGWEQIDDVSLNIGMDMNIANGDKIFRNVSGAWQTSAQPGSLLIRPVFSTALDATLSNPESTIADEPLLVSVYPNPASDLVRINGVENEFTVTVFDMTGRVILSFANETTFDISDFNAGLYLVDIRDQNGLSLYSGKLIKE